MVLVHRDHMGCPWRGRHRDHEVAERWIVICRYLTHVNVGRLRDGGPHDLIHTFTGTGELKRLRNGRSMVLILAHPVEQGTAIVSHRSNVYGEVFRLALCREGRLG